MERKQRTQLVSLVGLAGLGALALAWAYLIGGFVMGHSGGNVPLYVLAMALPLLLCWITYSLFQQFGIATGRHLALMVAVTIAVAAFAWQPWSPRVKFYRALKSIDSGMTEQDVRRIMAGYLDAHLHETGNDFVPDELHDKGVTHCLSYRWTNESYNADIGQVFLSDGAVVGARFLPD